LEDKFFPLNKICFIIKGKKYFHANDVDHKYRLIDFKVKPWRKYYILNMIKVGFFYQKDGLIDVRGITV